MNPQSSPYAIASSKMGMSEAAPALKDFLYTGGQNLDPATRAWCADFVNASLRDAGMKGTGSGMARSFLNYGQPVDQPQQGDIAVFSRGDPNGPTGHVGFFNGYDANGNIKVLGGNQGNSVSEGAYPSSRLLGFRRPQAGDGSTVAAAAGESQMPAYPWSPGQSQPTQQPQAAPEQAPQSQQAAPQQMAAMLGGGQSRAPSVDFAQLGKMLGLEDPPPAPNLFPQQQPRFPMAPSGAFFNSRRA